MSHPTDDAKNWYWRAGPVSPGPAVIVDIDGVLADASGRQHHIAAGDWRAFFEACGGDPVIEEMRQLLQLLSSDTRVLLVTGRPRRVQAHTVTWLDEWMVRWDLLITRDFGDYAGVDVFKREVLGDLRDYGFDIQLAFEDDPKNHAMYRSENVPCLYIHSGYYL